MSDEDRTKGKRIDFEEADDKVISNKVVQDFKEAETARQEKEDKWMKWYKLYRSYLDEKKYGSNLFIPYVYSIVETVAPRLVTGLFGVRPYLGILPTNSEARKNAKNLEKLIDYQLITLLNFKTTAANWIKEALIYGTSFLKLGWDYEEGEVPVTEPVAEIMGQALDYETVMQETVIKDQPLIEHVDLFDIYIDPYAKNIDEADYVIHKVFRNLEYLEEMEEEGIYENVDEVKRGVHDEQQQSSMAERLSEIGMQSQTPSQGDPGKVELIEYWTDDRVVVVANRSVVIRNEENPYHHMSKPFIRLVDTPVPHEIYGIGEIEPVEHLQYNLNTLRNQRVDNVNLIINKMWKVLRGADIDPNQLVSRPGGIVEVDDMEDVQPLVLDNVTHESYQEDEIIRNDIDRTTGVYDYARGEKTDRRETATTASILSDSANERFNLKREIMEDMGLKRLGKMLVSLNKQFIDRSMEVRILGEDAQIGSEVQVGMGFEDEDADAEQPTFIEISPEDIIGEFDVMPLGSTVDPAVNKESRLNNLINMYSMFAESPYVNQAKLIKKILEEADIKNVDELVVEDQEQMMSQMVDPDMMEQEMRRQEQAEGIDPERDGQLPVNTTEFGVRENERQ